MKAWMSKEDFPGDGDNGREWRDERGFMLNSHCM